MPVIINASTSAGAQITPDNSGVLQFQSNGANTVDVAANGTLTASNVTTTGRVTAGNVTISSGGSITFPDATTQTTAAAGGMTLLGTISTTSGTAANLTGLTLTSYKQLSFVLQGVSANLIANQLFFGSSTTVQITGKLAVNTDVWAGTMTVDLTNGYFSNNILAGTPGATFTGVSTNYAGRTDITTASTSITFNLAGNAFDAGSILVYGVK